MFWKFYRDISHHTKLNISAVTNLYEKSFYMHRSIEKRIWKRIKDHNIPNIAKLDTYYGHLRCSKYIICRFKSSRKLQINKTISHVPVFVNLYLSTSISLAHVLVFPKLFYAKQNNSHKFIESTWAQTISLLCS